jgi:hypothetical protein
MHRRIPKTDPEIQAHKEWMSYLPQEHEAAGQLFQLISCCYEQGSVLIRSNRAVTEWGEVVGAQVVATAILKK